MTLKALNINGTVLTNGLLLNALIIRDSSGKLGEIRGSTIVHSLARFPSLLLAPVITACSFLAH